MRIEVLYLEGCPNYEALLPHLRGLLTSAGSNSEITLRRIQSQENAERERFLGSPTVRVNGLDVDPGSGQRMDFGMKCRLYATPDGLRGAPPDEWLRQALARAKDAG